MSVRREAKTIQKFIDKFEKTAITLLKKIRTSSYITVFGNCEIATGSYKWKDLYVTSTPVNMMKKRHCIVETLKAINYKRDGSWTEHVAIAFMDEVIDLFLEEETLVEVEGFQEFVEDKIKEISERYNVTKSRLKTQVALFLNNLENGKDKFNIYSYFTPYEIVLWKYRSMEKLQQDIENEKIKPAELSLLRELEIIE